MKTDAFLINTRTGIYTVTRPITGEEIIEKAKTILAARVLNSHQLSDFGQVKDYLMTELAGLEHEVFGVIFLNNRHRVLGCRKLFNGTNTGCAVYSREVVGAVIRCNAAAVIFYHNHPSGIAEPSRSDEILTARLKEALALIDVRVLDHIVVGMAETVSFAERGLL